MADQRYPVRRSRRFVGPVLGGLALIAALIAGIAYRRELWRIARWAGGAINHWLTGWVPAHQRETGAILGFAVVALAINWIAHVRGRLRAWIFALVVEIGLWLLFWYGPGVPPLNELFGLRIPRLSSSAVAVSGAWVIALTGAVFWFLEAREEWLAYRRRHHVDDD
jgi:hypothetical protein